MNNQPKIISNRVAVIIIVSLLSAVAIAGYFAFFSPQSKAYTQACVERKACTEESQCGEGGTCVKKTSTTPVGLCTCKGTKLLWWFDDTTKVCQQRQFVGVYMMSSGLKTFATKNECESSLSIKLTPAQNIDAQFDSLDTNLKEIDSSLNDKAIDVNAN